MCVCVCASRWEREIIGRIKVSVTQGWCWWCLHFETKFDACQALAGSNFKTAKKNLGQFFNTVLLIWLRLLPPFLKLSYKNSIMKYTVTAQIWPHCKSTRFTLKKKILKSSNTCYPNFPSPLDLSNSTNRSLEVFVALLHCQIAKKNANFSSAEALKRILWP